MPKQSKTDLWIQMDKVDGFFEASRNIAYYRKKKGLTQAELAKLVGITRSYLSHIEAPNNPAHFSMDTFFKICSVLDVPPEVMIKSHD